MNASANSSLDKVENVLVIGASGGIAGACLDILFNSKSVKKIIAVSRNKISLTPGNGNQDTHVIPHHSKLDTHVIPQYDETSIAHICGSLQTGSIDLAICTLGVLHCAPNTNGKSIDGQPSLFPEKKIEDLTAESLRYYFEVNSIIPALWLRHLVNKMNRTASHMIFLSARVGSIGDNHLGGWYGYRASKSALNMLVKTAQVEYRRRCPGCDLVLYHPGTVDTALSKPFQRNVQPHKLFTPEFTASRMFDILGNKPNTPAPYYLDWQHKTIDW